MFWSMNFTFCFSKNFIYLVLAVLGLHCCGGFFLIVTSGDYSVNVVPKHLIPGVLLLPCTGSAVVAPRLSCLLHSMWNLPGSGIEPGSFALADRHFTIEPQAKPSHFDFYTMYKSEII